MSSDYVSRVEAELEEARLQQKITDSLIEALGTLDTKHLRQIQLRSDVWGALDKPIQAIIDQAAGREPVARMLLVSSLWRIINLLVSSEPLPVGKTRAQEEREAERRLEAAAEPEPVADEPEKPDGFQISFTRPNGKPVSFTAKSRRKEYKPGDYAKKLASMTPEQREEWRRLKRERQQRYRARVGRKPGS
jgi:hypothetical protein